ncbi:MAG TPA: SigE family RNA polymerase sigma factor [Candidatus Limnocylindrales bacterium]|nr:SigE family RNA polymerase sigma factor [Candidatus Limnocylindrales bacterium]
MTFEEFVAVRLPALARQATVLAGDPYVAEDVLQDVLVKAQLRWARISGLDAPEASLRKMIINELLSVRRRVSARLRRERLHLPVGTDGDGAEQVAQRDALIRMIRALPVRQRIVISLRYFDDMVDADIAAVLGCRLTTVRSLASRALAAMRVVAGRQPAREET